jgi:hypothetical protein
MILLTDEVYIMTDKKKPDPAKVAFLRSLPDDIKASITGEEAEQFMFSEYIPQSLYEKIKHLLTEEPDSPA